MMSNFNAPAWFSEWQEKYTSLLVNGLTDGPTYLRLIAKETPTLSVHLAFRPVVARVSEDIILVGGKLSVFPKDVKVPAANGHTMISWMSAVFPNIEFSKRSPARLGTVVMAPVPAPLDAEEATRKTLRESPFVTEMLGFIEEASGIEIENRDLVVEAIKAAIDGWLTGLFTGSGKAPATTLSKGKFVEGSNVLSIMDKLPKAPKES